MPRVLTKSDVNDANSFDTAPPLRNYPAMPERLHVTSRQWLLLESDDTPMHFGALMIFRLPRNHPSDALTRLGQRFAAASVVSPWNLKPAGRLDQVWKPTASDPHYHFRRSALPSPGGERELGELVSRLHSVALDLDRPPWECHLIEGLYDNQFAIYFKLHPALMSARCFFSTLTSGLARSARKNGIEPWWSQAVPDWQRAPVIEEFTRSLQSLPAVARSLPALWRNLRRANSYAAMRKPYSSARSALNTKIGHQRRLATQYYERQRLQDLADQLDASLTELLLSLCGAALRRFFKEYNALPDAPLVAGFLDATEDDDLYRELDLVSLGTDSHDPGVRLASVQRSLRASRRFIAELPAPLVPAYTFAILAPFVVSQRSRLKLGPPLFNVPIAGMSGAEKPVWLDGAKLENIWPMAPLLQGNALSISWMLYGDRVHIGFNGARDALPHLQRLAVYTGQTVANLEQLVERDDG